MGGLVRLEYSLFHESIECCRSFYSLVVTGMRYSEMIGKEIVDISAGMRLGLVAGTDLVINTTTGCLEALVIFQRAGLFATHEITVPWEGVKKVGKDLIIVDVSAAVEQVAGRSRATGPQLPSPKRTRHFVPGVSSDEANSAIAASFTEASFSDDSELSYPPPAESDIIDDKRSFRQRSRL